MRVDKCPICHRGELFGITFRQLERIITETRGINISFLNKPKKLNPVDPKSLKNRLQLTKYGKFVFCIKTLEYNSGGTQMGEVIWFYFILS